MRCSQSYLVSGLNKPAASPQMVLSSTPDCHGGRSLDLLKFIKIFLVLMRAKLGGGTLHVD